jgi:hypothetical protein
MRFLTYNHSKQLYSDTNSKNECMNPNLMRRQGKEPTALGGRKGKGERQVQLARKVPAQPPAEPMLGMRWTEGSSTCEHRRILRMCKRFNGLGLAAQPHKKRVQAWQCGGSSCTQESASTTSKEAAASNAAGQASASTTAQEARVRHAAGRVSASTTVKETGVSNAAGRASASTTEENAMIVCKQCSGASIGESKCS